LDTTMYIVFSDRRWWNLRNDQSERWNGAIPW